MGTQRHRSRLTKTRVRLANGGTMFAVAASTRAVRGPNPSRLRIDEADELSPAILAAALGQTMARAGVAAQTVISSTHYYPYGTMTEVLRRLSERGWTVIATLRYDERHARLIAFERMHRLPWPAMVERFDRRVQRRPGLAWFDATGRALLRAVHEQRHAPRRR